MNMLGTIGKGAAAIGSRMGAGLLGGPVGTAIGVASSLPLLIDLVRSFMDGGEHNADPKAIAAQRDKVVAELTKNGKSPEQARAEVDELLRPLVEETAESRDAEPTGLGEGLVSGALAVGGILAGRKFGKARMKDKDAPNDAPKDVATEVPQTKERQREFIGARGEARRVEQERGMRGELDSVSRHDRQLSVPERGRAHSTDYDEPGGDMPRRARGQIDEEGVHIPEVYAPGDDDLEMRAALARLRGVPRRPPGAYRAPPERLGVSSESLYELDERRMRGSMYGRDGD